MKLNDLINNSRVPLLGMITNNTRAVAIGWSEEKSALILRYYFENQPTEAQKEMVSDVLGEIVGYFWQQIKSADYECVVARDSIRSLDSLSAWLFVRSEFTQSQSMGSDSIDSLNISPTSKK